MRDFEDSTLWRVSAFERARQESGSSGFARLQGDASVLPTTLVSDLDHLARDQLLRLAVQLALVRIVVVAIRTADAERCLEQHHRRVQHVGTLAVEDLDVLEDFFDFLIAALRGDRRLPDARQHQSERRHDDANGRTFSLSTHVRLLSVRVRG